MYYKVQNADTFLVMEYQLFLSHLFRPINL